MLKGYDLLLMGHEPPRGLSDGLPAGMMRTAKHFDEVSIYRAASALEKAADWKGIRP